MYSVLLATLYDFGAGPLPQALQLPGASHFTTEKPPEDGGSQLGTSQYQQQPRESWDSAGKREP